MPAQNETNAKRQFAEIAHGPLSGSDAREEKDSRKRYKETIGGYSDDIQPLDGSYPSFFT
jgi:hypothetical protein